MGWGGRGGDVGRRDACGIGVGSRVGSGDGGGAKARVQGGLEGVSACPPETHCGGLVWGGGCAYGVGYAGKDLEEEWLILRLTSMLCNSVSLLDVM